MKQFFTILLTAVLLTALIIPAQSILADQYNNPDFYVQVNSSEYEINFRSSPGTGSTVITMVPNGQILHITDMVYSASDDLFFGFTVYNNYSGWVSLRQTLILTGGGYNAPDFYVQVSGSQGSINFRNWASTDSQVVTEIPNGSILHITDMTYNAGDDLFFGMTSYGGYTGWVSLRQTTLMKSGSASQYVEPAAPYSDYPSAASDYYADYPSASPDYYTGPAESISPDYYTGPTENMFPAAGTMNNYSSNSGTFKYFDDDKYAEISYGEEGMRYTYPDSRIIFAKKDNGDFSDYISYSDKPHYAVISRYDEYGAVVWEIVTYTVYGLNAGYSPIGASDTLFFYTNYDYIYAVDIETGTQVWEIRNELGGHDGGFSGKVVGPRGELYLCVRAGGKCMVISAGGTILYSDPKTYVGANLTFKDITYSDGIVYVTASNDTGNVNQFSFYFDGAYAPDTGAVVQPVNTSDGGAYAAAYHQLLLDIESDNRTLRSLVTDEFRWMTKILIADINADSIPEILYFTVENESGTFTPPSPNTFDYNHVAYSHLASFDPSTGRVFDLLDPGYTLYFNDYGNVDGYFRIQHAQYFSAGNNTIYSQGAGNISGMIQYWDEYRYLYPGEAMEKTYSVQTTGWDTWPAVTNATVAGLINGTVYLDLIINSEGATDYWLASYEEALNYFY